MEKIQRIITCLVTISGLLLVSGCIDAVTPSASDYPPYSNSITYAAQPYTDTVINGSTLYYPYTSYPYTYSYPLYRPYGVYYGAYPSYGFSLGYSSGYRHGYHGHPGYRGYHAWNGTRTGRFHSYPGHAGTWRGGRR